MDNKMINYYLDATEELCQHSGCIVRNYAAIIVKDNKVISTGWNNSPMGTRSCASVGTCVRKKLMIPRGTRYELCRSIHAEQECIIRGSLDDMEGSTLFLVGKDNDTQEYVNNPEPCMMCKRVIINAGIESVICRIDKENYKIINVQDWIVNDMTLQGRDTYSDNAN